MNYIIHISISLQIYIILALSLNLKTGFSGLLSLCQAAYYGTGAYLTTLLMVKFQFNFFFAIIVACVINVLINATITTWLAGRLRNLYFTLATMAIQIIFFGIIYNWTSLTGGSFGISGIPKPAIGSFIFADLSSFFWITLGFTLGVLIFCQLFIKTPLCRMIECTRDDEVWISALGKNPIQFKWISISLSVILATIAGGLYASFMSYISPSSFNMDESILILTIVLVGGTGNVIGSVSGAALYVLLPELLHFIPISDDAMANIRMILYSLILILIIRFKPNGLFGKFEIKS